MKCEKAQELFSDYLEGTLERPMAVAFERHIAECSSCDRDYACFKATWEMLGTMPVVEPPPGFATQVVMAVQMQREEARRSKPRWLTMWNDLFATGIPAKVLVGAAAAVLCVQIAVSTPLKGVVSAWIIGPPAARTVSNVKPMEWQSNAPAQAWMNSALSFGLAGSRDTDGRSIFRLLLKPENVSSKHVTVYLMSSHDEGFSTKSLNNASVIFNDSIGENGRVIPFILGQTNGRHDVMTAMVEWEHRQRTFREAVFVPVQMGEDGKANIGSVDIPDTDLYTALEQASGTFGVVILAQADISAKISGIEVKNASAEDVLFKITKNANLTWRPIGNQVYIIERKFE